MTKTTFNNLDAVDDSLTPEQQAELLPDDDIGWYVPPGGDVDSDR